MKKIYISIMLILLNISIFADGSGAFKLDLKKDLILGTTAIAAFSAGSLLRENSDQSTSKFGWIDEDITFEYNEGIDSFSDYLSLAPLFLPLPLLLDEWDVENISVLGVMFLESALLTVGVKDIFKSFIHRPRPYNFYASTPDELLEENDRNLGFPSGHTSIAFMGASFSTYIFSQGTASKKQKYIMGITTFGIATTTAVLRVSSGSHYMFDVLTGAALGSLVGFGVPYLHKVIPENITPVISLNGVGVSILL